MIWPPRGDWTMIGADTAIGTGSCLDLLPTLPENSVHCCITSPPYWGLRSYNVGAEHGEIGCEQTPDEYVAQMVQVFREVRRILRDDGVLWLNLGDSYTSGGRKDRDPSLISASSGVTNRSAGMKRANTPYGLKPKDLVGIPWRVAFALQADGWYLRSEIIWHKPNPMPESCTDRPTKAHEQIFLLAKQPRYYYDALAISEPAAYGGYKDARAFNGKNADDVEDPTWDNRGAATRNRRSVWTIATQPFAEAHFATFPPKLVEPCLLAGCPARVCAACGTPWERTIERDRQATRPGRNTKITGDAMTDGNRDPGRHVTAVTTTGFRPTCRCEAGTVAGSVLDPFAGAGTVALVAARQGRRSIGTELNPEYVEIINRRLRKELAQGILPFNENNSLDPNPKT